MQFEVIIADPESTSNQPAHFKHQVGFGTIVESNWTRPGISMLPERGLSVHRLTVWAESRSSFRVDVRRCWCARAVFLWEEMPDRYIFVIVTSSISIIGRLVARLASRTVGSLLIEAWVFFDSQYKNHILQVNLWVNSRRQDG